MTLEASFLLSKVCNSSILINSHSNLNYSAGDTIMISNYMNTLMKNNNKVTLLSKYAIGLTFIRNLEYKNYNIIIKKNNEEIIQEIDNQGPKNNFIFIRNHEILDNLKNKPYLSKTILYGLDIHLESIKKLDNKFLCVITQSEKLKELYINNKILGNKIVIIEPFAYKYNFNLPERNDNEIRLIYCGTLREEENIIEIIEEFKKIHQERPEALLKIVYGKIHGNQEFTQKVNKYIKEGVKGITFKHNLSHRDACCEIATSDIGICWRKNDWGDNGEISTKMKEYEMYGLKVLNNITIINNSYKSKIINNIYINEYFKIAVVKELEINIKNMQKKLEEIYNFVDILIVIYKDKKNIINNFKSFKVIEINISEFGEIPNTFRICKYFTNSIIFPIHFNYIDLYDKLYFNIPENNISNICKNFYYIKNYKLVNIFLSNFNINRIPEKLLLDLCVTDEIMLDFEISKLKFHYEEKYINVSILELEKKETYVEFLNHHSNKNEHIVINLNKSIDRKLHLIKSFEKIGIKPIFYTPIDFDYIKDHYNIIMKLAFKFQERKIASWEYPSNCFDIFKICYQINNNQKIITQGAFSYLYTYIEILKYAIKNKLNNLFLYDDDVAFHNKYNIDEIINKNNGIISLGALDYSWQKNIKMCHDKLYNCKGSSYGSHALIINKNVFHKLLYVLENKILPVDCSPLHLFKYNFDSKIIYPNMAIQRTFKSNINSSNVQYDNQSDSHKALKNYGWDMKNYFLPTIKTILIYDEKMSDEIKSIFNSWEINIDFQYINDKFIYDENNYDYIFLYINNKTIQQNKSLIKENTIIIEKEFLYNKDSRMTYYTCDSLLKSNKYEKKYTCIAVLATFMKRFHLVKKVINNILPQVDKIYIYANDYSEKNKEDLLKIINSEEKVEILLGNAHDGDIKDNGKLYLINNIVKKINHDYIIVIDDDLNYPSDYVEKHILSCLKYNNNIVSCIHGGLFSNITYDIFRDRYLYHYRSIIKENKFVTYSGTGTICIPYKFTSFINYEKTMYTGMVDMYFMNNMNFYDINRICISRNKWGWLKEFNDDSGETLYDIYKNNNIIQQSLINFKRSDKKKIIIIESKIFSIQSYSRYDIINELSNIYGYEIVLLDNIYKYYNIILDEIIIYYLNPVINKNTMIAVDKINNINCKNIKIIFEDVRYLLWNIKKYEFINFFNKINIENKKLLLMQQNKNMINILNKNKIKYNFIGYNIIENYTNYKNTNRPIDIFMYGCTENYYPFRLRMLNICNKLNYEKKINFVNIEHIGYFNNINSNMLNNIYKYLNQSKYCICCTSIFKVILRKHLECLSNNVISITDEPETNYLLNHSNSLIIKNYENLSDFEIENIIIDNLKKYKFKDLSQDVNRKHFFDLIVN